MQMKLHAIECLINIFTLPEMITDAKTMLEEVTKHLDATFKAFIAAMSQESLSDAKVNLEMLNCCFYLVTNLIADPP